MKPDNQTQSAHQSDPLSSKCPQSENHGTNLAVLLAKLDRDVDWSSHIFTSLKSQLDMEVSKLCGDQDKEVVSPRVKQDVVVEAIEAPIEDEEIVLQDLGLQFVEEDIEEVDDD